MKIKINILKQIFFLFILLSILILPYFVFAQEETNNSNPINRLETVGSGDSGPYVEANQWTLSMIVGQAVNIFLGFLGVIFIILIIIAGYKWMMAQGNQEEVNKAKDSLKSSIIGLIIVVGAYAIWEFISSQLLNYLI